MDHIDKIEVYHLVEKVGFCDMIDTKGLKSNPMKDAAKYLRSVLKIQIIITNNRKNRRSFRRSI